ncbi:MAG: nucleotidyltransferase family protein, partial [Bacteroidota bacterium]
MTIPPDIAIIIPAAGASVRMGTPKQCLPWGKTTLLGHAVTQALQSEAQGVFVVLGAYEAMLRPQLVSYPVTLLKNEDWKNGLGSSIACGVRHLLSTHPLVEGVLIMLADQPLIDYSYLNVLIRHFRADSNKLITTSYGKKSGVPAVFGKAYFKALSDLQDDYGARQLIEAQKKHVVALNP